jgi:hypothetical protein
MRVSASPVPSQPHTQHDFAELAANLQARLDGSEAAHAAEMEATRARYETALDESGIVNGLVNNHLGQADAKVVVPRDWTRSILFKRISVAGQPHSMPPLAKQRVDKTGIGLIAEWIASMEVEEDGPLPDEWQLMPIGTHGKPPSATWRKGSFFLNASAFSSLITAFRYIGTQRLFL